MAGLGETCSCIGALLYWIKYAVRKQDEGSYTSRANKWMELCTTKQVPYLQLDARDFIYSKKWINCISTGNQLILLLPLLLLLLQLLLVAKWANFATVDWINHHEIKLCINYILYPSVCYVLILLFFRMICSSLKSIKDVNVFSVILIFYFIIQWDIQHCKLMLIKHCVLVFVQFRFSQCISSISIVYKITTHNSFFM